MELKNKPPILKIVGISLFVVLNTGQAWAELSTNIPSTALTKNGKKVKICHFPPGNPANYQKIKISVNALGTHINHHDDVFAVNGKCPPINASGWEYLDSYDSQTGKPDNTSSDCSVPSDILAKVHQILPEHQKLPADSPMLVGDGQANLFLSKTANIDVAVVHEGAGYKNSLAFFSFDKGDLSNLSTEIIDEKIIFPNFSMKNSGGDLSVGDTVALGEFGVGKGIGFTVIANGWNGSEVRSDRTDQQIFRTVKGMNPETPGPGNKNYHTVLLSDPEAKLLVLAVEDLNRENASYNDWSIHSDDDFNDVVFAICVDPFDAIEDIEDIIDIETGEVPSGQKDQGVTGRLNWSERTVPPIMPPVQQGGGVTPP